jgi:5-methylcytosine-specific restriction endonuclease McrA
MRTMSGNVTQTAKLRMRKIWKQNPHCCYCGRVTVLATPGDPTAKPNTATVEHLRRRVNGVRPGNPGHVQWVLACHECNGEMSAARDVVEQRTRYQRIPSLRWEDLAFVKY